MTLAVVHSRAQSGVTAPPVRVEVHLSGGLPTLSIVGLPDAAVRESKDRVRAAILCSQFDFPQRRITVNLSPADLPKDGGRFDLPIALGILVASGQLPRNMLANNEFLGELALTGELRGITGVLPAVLAASRERRGVVLPLANAAEAALPAYAGTRTATTLLQVCAFLRGEPVLSEPVAAPVVPVESSSPDLADVRGQIQARRALEIAAAGAHNLLMSGPPGSGKSMLASRLSSILPPLDDAEALECAAIASISGRGFDPARWREPPYRCPHHTASGVALVGGGSNPRPGEISLAHGGVLFLDELPEWDRRVLEVLREPLESGRVTNSRAARQAEFPARFQLIAAMNPCPCGWAGDPSGRCNCSQDHVARYRNRISGPLLDRIDLLVPVPRVPATDLRPDAPGGESSAVVRERVLAARARQQARAGRTNAHLSQAETSRHCVLTPDDQTLLERAIDRLRLSARASQRILRVARTIADLADEDAIGTRHLGEAIGYRRFAGVG